ncbi:MAG TPA: exosortase A [Telluria sp.]
MFLTPSSGVAGAAAPAPAVSPLSSGAWMLIALAMLAPFALYFGTARSIVSIWNSSETFAHGYIILPISLWLIWRRRANFAAYPPLPYWPALLLVAIAGAGWLAARMGEVQVVMQYAFVALFPLIALAVLGKRLAGSLAFPLLFLLFAVPFGEIFVGPLIEFTADFTVAAVQATGIPVLRNGTRFELPTGSWSVVEACSGVRYLISSITLGALYAYLTYRSTKRRLAFVALSIVVPIVANWLRAYMIVMIGHTSGMTMATGVDHLIYGWAFFGLVMFLMFWIGSYWREDDLPDPAPAPVHSAAEASATSAARSARVAPMAAAVIALVALWPAFAHFNDQANRNEQPVALASVPVSWTAVPAFSTWTQRFMQPDASFNAAYRAGSGQPVGLSILYYRNQNSAKSLISSVNRLTGPKDAWHEVGAGTRLEPVGGRQLAVRETTLQGPEGKLLVWHWFRVGGHDTASNAVGKLRQAQSKLLFRGDDGAAIMLSAPYGEQADDARAALRSFLLDNYKAVDATLVAAAGR